LVALVLAVVVANFLPLSGIVDQNPLLERPELTVAEQPGWVEGFRTIDPNDGFSSQALGHQAAHQWLHGEIPYWNHYEGTGFPLAGGMQSAALFLPFVLLLHFANGLLYLHVVLEVLAAVGTYLLLRRLRVGHVAAVVGGIAFGLCGTMVWVANAVMNPVAFLPWLVLGVELATSDDEDATPWARWAGPAVIALALSGSLYAGFPEVAYIDCLLVAGWAVLRLVQRRSRLWRGVRDLAAGLAVGLCLAAPILVAFGTYVADAYVGNHDGSSGHTALGLIGLPAVVLPYVYGPIFGYFGNYPTPELGLWWSAVGGYLPMAAVALALVGLAGRRERGLKRFLLGWSLVVGAIAFGMPVLSSLLNFIPTLKYALFQRYSPPMVALAVIVMAALALDEIIAGEIRRRSVAIGGAVAFVVLGAAALGARGHVSLLSGAAYHRQWAVLSVLLALVVTVAVVAAALVPARLRWLRPVLAGGALAVEAMVLFIVPQLSTKHDAVVDLAPVSFLQEHLGTSSYATLGPIAPNYGSYFGIRGINVNDLPLPKPYAELVERRLNRNTTPYTFTGTFMGDPKGPTNKDQLVANVAAYRDAGVRYVVARRGTILPADVSAAALVPAFADQSFEIYELSGWKPYYEPDAGSGCRVERSDFTGAVVDCPAATTIVRRETFLPGWSATVNGQPVGITDRDGLFQVVPVPAGRSTIETSYRPPLATLSWVVFFAGGFALVVSTPPVWGRLSRGRRATKTALPDATD
jgi:hypothetical protein